MQWTDSDTHKMVTSYEEIRDKYPDMGSGDQSALVASKISHDSFRPSSKACESRMAFLRKAARDQAATREVIKDGIAQTVPLASDDLETLVELLGETIRAAIERDTKSLAAALRNGNEQIVAELKGTRTVLLRIETSARSLNDLMERLLNGLAEGPGNGK